MHDPDTALLLDNGVTGIVFPDVNTAADAKSGVNAARFPPVGRRSVSGGYPHFDFRPTPVAESVPALDAATLVVCMIETRQGLANVEEIAAVPGVDVLHVGTNDLLVDMGKTPKAKVPEAIQRYLASAA